MYNNQIDANWKRLILIGGIMALIAGILFRRNLALEVGIFGSPIPVTIEGWFTLLDNNRLLGLTYLHAFDIVNYALLIGIYLALYLVLKNYNKGLITIAFILALIGIIVYFSTNSAFSMLSLSHMYTNTTSETIKSQLVAAGYALLANTRFGLLSYPGNGGLISLSFIATASLIISIVMLKSKVFSKLTSLIGITASLFDLMYCLFYLFIPMNSAIIAVMFIPLAGLLLLVWHVLIGLKLIKLSK